VSQNFSQLPLSSSSSSSFWTKQNDRRHLSFSSLAEVEEPAAAAADTMETTNSAFKSSKQTSDGEGGMGKQWVKWMHRNGMRNWVVPGAVMATTWIKWSIGLGSYSGI
jgi:alpha-1,3-glucosyltransferase